MVVSQFSSAVVVKISEIPAEHDRELDRHEGVERSALAIVQLIRAYRRAFDGRRFCSGRLQVAAKRPNFALDIDLAIHNNMVVDRLGTTFAALSDPTRRALIQRLSHGPASVQELTAPFALSQQMISKHIAYLVRARIVMKTKHGRTSCCTLRPAAIKTVSDWAVGYRRFWEESFDKLEVVVNQMKTEEIRDGRKHGG